MVLTPEKRNGVDLPPPLFMDFGYLRELKGEHQVDHESMRLLRMAGRDERKKGTGKESRQVITKEADAIAWVSGMAAEIV